MATAIAKEVLGQIQPRGLKLDFTVNLPLICTLLIALGTGYGAFISLQGDVARLETDVQRNEEAIGESRAERKEMMHVMNDLRQAINDLRVELERTR